MSSTTWAVSVGMSSVSVPRSFSPTSLGPLDQRVLLHIDRDRAVQEHNYLRLTNPDRTMEASQRW